eukprot:TRINITY_DN17557_c0_g1_i4.p1 TRINITY_DN17557_c0_g1~~TRINITY_DN17557_c0_g1_i4.p1  ORF type:complete len:196 (-),score=25.74 TRINITY_DN17557_c0_g1_i4:99-686(-)
MHQADNLLNLSTLITLTAGYSEDQTHPENQTLQRRRKKKWTAEEIRVFERLHNRYGNNWSLIAEHMSNRTVDMIRSFARRMNYVQGNKRKCVEDSLSSVLVDLGKEVHAKTKDKIKKIRRKHTHSICSKGSLEREEMIYETFELTPEAGQLPLYEYPLDCCAIKNNLSLYFMEKVVQDVKEEQENDSYFPNVVVQ